MPDAFLLDSSAFLTQHRLSLADVFIAASAQRLGAVLAHGLLLGCKLGKAGAAACGRGRMVAAFVAEIQIEADPLAVVGTLGFRHPPLVRPSLKRGRYLSGNRLHGNASESYLPSLGRCSAGYQPGEAGKLKSASDECFTTETRRSKTHRREADGVVGGRQPLAYHPKTGR